MKSIQTERKTLAKRDKLEKKVIHYSIQKIKLIIHHYYKIYTLGQQYIL